MAGKGDPEAYQVEPASRNRERTGAVRGMDDRRLDPLVQHRLVNRPKASELLVGEPEVGLVGRREVGVEPLQP